MLPLVFTSENSAVAAFNAFVTEVRGTPTPPGCQWITGPVQKIAALVEAVARGDGYEAVPDIWGVYKILSQSSSPSKAPKARQVGPAYRDRRSAGLHRHIAHALGRFGIDVGHEAIGADGISSWMFAVEDVNLPFGAAGYARNSRFVFADTVIAVVRIGLQAVFAMQIENAKNIQSYAFRRRWIKRLLDVDLDSFGTDFDRALAAYIFWYRLVMLCRPVAYVCLERAAQDLARLFAARAPARAQDAGDRGTRRDH